MKRNPTARCLNLEVVSTELDITLPGDTAVRRGEAIRSGTRLKAQRLTEVLIGGAQGDDDVLPGCR